MSAAWSILAGTVALAAGSAAPLPVERPSPQAEAGKDRPRELELLRPAKPTDAQRVNPGSF